MNTINLEKEQFSSKGITLIALVITIIVLLILAGISIAMLTGENGILTKADTATRETKRQEVIEKAKLDIFEYEAENEGKITDDKALEIIEKYDKDYNKDETFEFKTNEKDEKYIITENGYNILVSEIWRLPRKIKFIMEGRELEAIEGMTWKQWLLEKRKRRDK